MTYSVLRWLVMLLPLSGWACARHAGQEVVIYTSVDEEFAHPIAEQFAPATGITTRLVPDTEETKSTGLLNRLLAEKERPQADVFWSGDPVRAALLKAHGVAAPYHSPQAEGLPPQFSDPQGYWTGFSARARVLIYNRTLGCRRPRAAVGHGPACPAVPGQDLSGQSLVRHHLDARGGALCGLGRRAGQGVL